MLNIISWNCLLIIPWKLLEVMNVINLPWWPVQWEGPDIPPLVFPRRDFVGVVGMAYAVRFILRKYSLFMQILSHNEI